MGTSAWKEDLIRDLVANGSKAGSAGNFPNPDLPRARHGEVDLHGVRLAPNVAKYCKHLQKSYDEDDPVFLLDREDIRYIAPNDVAKAQLSNSIQRWLRSSRKMGPIAKLKASTVPDDDPRKDARGQRGAVARKEINKWEVFASYGGLVLEEKDYNEVINCEQLRSQIDEIEKFSMGPFPIRIWEDGEFDEKHLIFMGYRYGNETSLMNAPQYCLGIGNERSVGLQNKTNTLPFKGHFWCNIT